MGTITVLDSTGSPQTVAKVAATGSTTGANALPVVLASDDPVVVAFGAQADAAAAADNSTASLVALLKRNNQRLTQIDTDITASNAQLPTTIGPAAKAASLTVTGATDDPAALGIGGTADAAATAGSTGSISAKLRTLTAQLPATLGAAAKASSLSVALATDSPQLPTTAAGSVQATITRPANVTQYAAGDVVGGAITLATGLTSGQRCMLTSMDLMLQIAALPGTPGMTTLDVHFYNVTPPSALADNAVFDIPSGDRASYLGKVSLTTPIDYGSTLMSQLDAINKAFQMSGSASLFAYLVTTTSFTPANNSEVYLLRAHFLGL